MAHLVPQDFVCVLFQHPNARVPRIEQEALAVQLGHLTE